MQVWIEKHGKRFWPERYDPKVIAAREKREAAAMTTVKAKPLMTITAADLATLGIRDRLSVEMEILMARQATEQTAILGPLPDHPELPMEQAKILVQFCAHLPSGKIIHESSRGLWASGSFDKHVGRIKDAMKVEGPGMLASTWLSQYRAVQSMGWDPGEPMIIENKTLTESGWVHAPGCRSFVSAEGLEPSTP
jgi:hypothetical protein